MASPPTEQAETRYRDLDLWSATAVVGAIVDVQRQAVDAVSAAGPALGRASEAVAAVVKRGGRMAYAGAGSSGLIAQIDALELPGTFGVSADRVPVLLAGGPASLFDLPCGAEDDADGGGRMVEELNLGPDDALIALSASGTTPFTLAAMRAAGERGAVTVGIVCNPCTPILTEARFPVHLATSPEVIAGSTRMGAGTAQKCALNALSTLVGIRLGHTYAGLMVNMAPANTKLRNRAIAIVADVAGVEQARAASALDQGGTIKHAILLCAGANDRDTATLTLQQSGGNLRVALAALHR